MQKILKLLKPSLTLGSVLFLAACDGQAPKSPAELIDLGSRYDTSSLSANLTATADMPSFLSQNDVISHHSLTTDTSAQFGVPLEVTAIGFDGTFNNNKTITVNSAGKILVDEGLSSVPYVNYSYGANSNSSPRLGSFTISNENAYATGTTVGTIMEDFETRMDAILQNGAGGNGTMHDLIHNSSATSVEVGDAIAAAARLMGLVANNTSIVGTFAQSGIIESTSAVVLLHREIIYTPTSTNADLVNNKRIEGSFELNDTYAFVSIIVVDDGLKEIILEPLSITLADGKYISHAFIDSRPVTSTGFFSLDLTSL